MLIAAEETTLASCLEKVDEYRCAGDSFAMQFSRDGRFTLRPLGMSGQKIDGTWHHEAGSTYVINGVWDWTNGETRNDFSDVRRMTIELHPTLEVVTIEPSPMPFDDPWYRCVFSCGPAMAVTTTSATVVTPR